MKQNLLIALFAISTLFVNAKGINDSCTMQISLITCAPGADLYSLFGHTAIRVQDSTRGMDIVYNYGFFDDSDPMFYVHFTNGLMRYSVSAETFSDFMSEYQYEHRAVQAQLLNLSCAEKMRLYESLRQNTLIENRFYNYQFHTDNCTTRAGKIIEANTSEPLIYGNVLPAPKTKIISFRDMIHEYLDKQPAYWSELGIDFLLGANLDKKPDNLQAIHFLPDYLYRGMDSAHEGNKPMVLDREYIIQFPEASKTSIWFTPLVLFSLIFLIGLIFYWRNLNSALLIYDIVFFSLLGLLGIVMAYLWLGRIDTVCRNNINILWAIPTHIIAVFFIRKKFRWVTYYFLTTAIMAAILLVGFPWWFQRMNMAVVPILVIIIFRSYLLYKSHTATQTS